MPTVEFINLREGFVILEDGSTLPFDSFYDLEGEETTDPDLAVMLLCGSNVLGWYVIPLFDIFPSDLH
jgi:hypothetical protein